MKIRNNSFNFDRFETKEAEALRLEVRANAGIAQLIPSLKATGLTNKSRVLDVGTGTGRRAIEIAKSLPRGEVVGIDTSQDLLKLASAQNDLVVLKNLYFKLGDVTSRRSLEPLGKFDFVYLRLVVQHLKEPVLALQNLRDILNPGGVIFLEDTDRDWMEVYPSSLKWKKLYVKIKDVQKKHGGDPNSGTKLGSHLVNAGFQKVNVTLIPVFGSNDTVAEWLNNYAPTYLNLFDRKTRLRGQMILEAMKVECKTKPMFFYQTWFQAVGRKLK